MESTSCGPGVGCLIEGAGEGKGGGRPLAASVSILLKGSRAFVHVKYIFEKNVQGSKSQKDKYMKLLIVESNKKGYKTETDSKILSPNFLMPKGKCGGGINRGLGMDICTQVSEGWVGKRNGPYSPG